MKVTLLVGETGAGKSSLIQAILKSRGFSEAESVRIGHGSASCTMDASLFDSGEPLGYLVDTRGTDDSKANTSDVELLNSTMREMYQRSNGNPIEAHVIWMCNSKTRATASYQTQARFIQSLFVGYGARSNWGSVMVVIQKGSTAGHQDAPVSAASLSGCRDDSLANRVVMADVLGWGDPNDTKAAEQAEIFRMLPSDARKTLHKYEESEFVEEVSSILSTMPSCTISFRNRRCTKCGQRGDDRFFVPSCHPKEQRVHSQPSLSKHVNRYSRGRHGSLSRRHPSVRRRHQNTRRRHSSSSRVHGASLYRHSSSRRHSSTSYYHSGSLQRHHPGSLQENFRYHTERYVSSRTYYHPSSYIPVYLFLYGHWSCCGAGGRSSRGCSVRRHYSTRPKKVTLPKTWSCCEASEYNSGCREKYSCCYGEKYSTGCQRRCSNCYQSFSSSGCLCSECGRSPSSGHCIEECRACKANVSSSGCKLRGCGCRPGSKGCIVECVSCRRSPSSTGCEQYCGSCSSTTLSGGCEEYCARCNRKSSDSTCITEYFCGNCNRSWNDSYYCTYSCCGRSRGSPGCRVECCLCHRTFASRGCQHGAPHRL